MIKTSVLRYAAIGMASVSLAGFAAASTVSFDTTGPDSTNKVKLDSSAAVNVSNDNAVGVANLNVQGASSGEVEAKKNTSVDDLASGDASNENDTDTDVDIDNSGSSNAALDALAGFGAGDHDVSFDTTGPDSYNKVEINDSAAVNISNSNEVQVINENVQGASTGDVSAYKNTTVGGLTSGSASNSNTTSTSISISN
jgi:hypothetical protein